MFDDIKLDYKQKLKATIESFPRELIINGEGYTDEKITASAIVCVDKNNAIGYKNKLVVKSRFDMKVFKTFTMNKIVVMGRNTFESMDKKPLPYRLNVVVTTNRDYDAGEYKDFVLVLNSLDIVFNKRKFVEALLFKFGFVPKVDDNIVLIGGASIYTEILARDLIDKFVVDIVDYEAPNADTYFDGSYLASKGFKPSAVFHKTAKEIGELNDLSIYILEKNPKPVKNYRELSV